MNKVKKFEISVVDRTYSKIVSNLVKFYSSDSSLEVIFILAEEGYEFDSAELVLSNTDGSLITRPLTKVPEGYSYEFEENIIPHYGEWKGQVVLYSGNDSYVSSKVVITIEDDLLGERPPTLTDVYSWTSLKRYADGLIDELKQAVLSIEGVEDTFNENETVRQSQFSTAEQSRQTTFETNESERDRTFESNETTRQAQELEREKAESQRQTVFEDNESSPFETFNANEATRQVNETTRQRAETQRESAESSRVSAEEQRKTDHANRSAELAGKADKKQEDWITPTLVNGATGNVQYRKNQMGRVEFRGRLKMGNQNYAFILPSGYRPSDSSLVVLPEFPSGSTTRRVSITNAGLFYVYNSSEKEVSLDTLSCPVQGV